MERSEREDVVGVCSYFCMSEREETEGRLGTEGLMASSVAVCFLVDFFLLADVRFKRAVLGKWQQTEINKK